MRTQPPCQLQDIPKSAAPSHPCLTFPSCVCLFVVCVCVFVCMERVVRMSGRCFLYLLSHVLVSFSPSPSSSRLIFFVLAREAHELDAHEVCLRAYIPPCQASTPSFKCDAFENANSTHNPTPTRQTTCKKNFASTKKKQDQDKIIPQDKHTKDQKTKDQ